MRFIGTGGILGQFAKDLGVGFNSVLSPKWRRYASLNNFLDIFKLPVGFFQSLYYVWHFMPDLVFSKGGYDSFLPSFATRLMGIPLYIHESDAIPGKANIWLSHFAKKIFIAFDSAKQYLNYKNAPSSLV